MEKVTIRNFSQKISHYLDRIERGEVIEVRGMRIGLIKNSGIQFVEPKLEEAIELVKELRTPSEKEEKLRIAREALANMGELQGVADFYAKQEPLVDTPECDKCKQQKDILYAHTEEGEEYRVCEFCMRKMNPRVNLNKLTKV